MRPFIVWIGIVTTGWALDPMFVEIGLKIENASVWDAGQECDVDFMRKLMFNTPSVPSIVCDSKMEGGHWNWNYTMVIVSHHDQILTYLGDLKETLDEAFELLESGTFNVSHTNTTELVVGCKFQEEYYDMTSRTCIPRNICGEEVDPGSPQLWEPRYTVYTNEWQDSKCVFNTMVLFFAVTCIMASCCCFHCCQHLWCERRKEDRYYS